MPEASTTFGIPYPCEGELVTVAGMSSYALGVESALTTVWADATLATQPPAVSVFNGSGQVVATGVTATLTHTTVNYDRGGFFNIATPTILTIPANGTYFAASTSSGNVTGNVTSVRFAILRNGAEVAYWESQATGALTPSNSLTVNVMLPACVAGDQITFTTLYTGTQPTLSFFSRVNVTRLAIP